MHTKEFHSAAKKNEVMNFVGKRIEVDHMPSEAIQTQKNKCHMFSLICGP